MWKKKGSGIVLYVIYVQHKVNCPSLLVDLAAEALQASGAVPHVLAWGISESEIPAIFAAQFAHTFLSTVLSYAALTLEAYSLASHVTQAFFTTKAGETYTPPQMPQLLSTGKPALPDNSSIPPADDIPGVDAEKGVAASIAGTLIAGHSFCSQPRPPYRMF